MATRKASKKPGKAKKKPAAVNRKPPAKINELPKMGRPSDYKPTYVAQAAKLAELGATDREVADFFGVSEATLYRWQHTHRDFCEALKVGKEIADDRVEKSLYRRAIGYSHDAVKIMQFQGEEVVVPYVEHAPPDVTACIFWLKNRRKGAWRDKVEVEHGLDDNLADALKAARERAASR